MPNILIEGLITHLPDADSEDKSFARDQISAFITLIDDIRATGLPLPKNTLANSAAITDLPEGYFNQVRAGIILYGSYPSDYIKKDLDLRAVMSVKSPIITYKKMLTDTTVSYKRRYTLENDSVIAVLPMGYRHGYLRSLSGKASGIYNGRRVPQAGVVCMDMCMFDLGPDASPELGDEITLLGRDGGEVITIEELAEAGGTISYEIMTSLGMRSRRYYLQGGEERFENRIEGHRLRGE
jgi:alanine racemase